MKKLKLQVYFESYTGHSYLTLHSRIVPAAFIKYSVPVVLSFRDPSMLAMFHQFKIEPKDKPLLNTIKIQTCSTHFSYIQIDRPLSPERVTTFKSLQIRQYTLFQVLADINADIYTKINHLKTHIQSIHDAYAGTSGTQFFFHMIGQLASADDLNPSGYIHVYNNNEISVKTFVQLEKLNAVIVNYDYEGFQRGSSIQNLDKWSVHAELNKFLHNNGVKNVRIWNIEPVDNRLKRDASKWFIVNIAKKFVLSVLRKSILVTPFITSYDQNAHAGVDNIYGGYLFSTHANKLDPEVMESFSDGITIISLTYFELAKQTVTKTPINNEQQLSCVLKSALSTKIPVFRLTDQDFGELLAFSDMNSNWHNMLLLITQRSVYKEKQVSSRLRSFYTAVVKREGLGLEAVKFCGLNIRPNDESESCSL